MAEVGGATGRGASIKSDRKVDFLISSSLSQFQAEECCNIVTCTKLKIQN